MEPPSAFRIGNVEGRTVIPNACSRAAVDVEHAECVAPESNSVPNCKFCTYIISFVLVSFAIVLLLLMVGLMTWGSSAILPSFPYQIALIPSWS
jgi:hypothetical protein